MLYTPEQNFVLAKKMRELNVNTIGIGFGLLIIVCIALYAMDIWISGGFSAVQRFFSALFLFLCAAVGAALGVALCIIIVRSIVPDLLEGKWTAVFLGSLGLGAVLVLLFFLVALLYVESQAVFLSIM
jgi:hypothetical protein